jgi:hypothetical protein
MPESEGYLGIITLLTEALRTMDDGPAKDLVTRARAETVRQARQAVTSLAMGMELGRLLSKDEQADRAK